MTVSAWPDLALPSLAGTAQTLQLFTQVVGKVRLARTPWLNHSWHVTLYVSARGLTTGLIAHDQLSFDLEFDFAAGALVVRTTAGGRSHVALVGRSVAAFHTAVLEALASLGVPVTIDGLPNELPDAIPFARDTALRPYDPAAAQALWQALVRIEQVFGAFRTRFLGKCSPVHLFWGGLDLAVTRFSGRRAPLHPGGIPHLRDEVTREAYSHEVSSAGFWPGGAGQPPSFYSYAYPAPAGFADAQVSPSEARFDTGLGEFLLPYEAVRAAPDPEAALLAFLQSTYEAAADLAAWNRADLECGQGVPGRPRPVG